MQIEFVVIIVLLAIILAVQGELCLLNLKLDKTKKELITTLEQIIKKDRNNNNANKQ